MALGHASIGGANASAAEYEYASSGYTATALGTLGGSFSSAQDINARAQVVGSSAVESGFSHVHAFQWEKGQMTDLGSLYSTSGALAINDRGQTVGWSDTPGTDHSPHAVLWNKGEITDLGTLDGLASYATAINNRGEVVGWSLTKTGQWRAFLWRDGVMTNLGDGEASDINDRGDVVGSRPGAEYSHATLWVKGTALDLGVGHANGINARGQIAGSWRAPETGVWSACLWEGTAIVDLGTMVDANDLNSRGDVVGMGLSAIGYKAVVWKRGRVTELPTTGAWSSADGVNERGQIVGTQNYIATLWEPTP